MEKVLSSLSMFSLVSFLVESVTEYAFDWFKYKKYAALGVGVLISCSFQLSVFAVLLQVFGVQIPRATFGWWVGVVISGILFGRGGNIFHDLKAKLFPSVQEVMSRRCLQCPEK